MELQESSALGEVITCVKYDEKYKNVDDKLVEDFPEHIIGCKLLKGEGRIVTVTSRNILTIRKSSNLQVERQLQCDYFATSICSQITGESISDLKVYFGSVIGDLIDWKPQESPIWREGHKGMIFSIVTDSSRIFTISDDRTVRMWSITDRNAGPICTVFGHTARPFSICVDESRHLIYTGGIEQTVFCWKYTPETIQLVRKTPISCGVIRKIEKNEDNELIISAQDGNVLKFDETLSESLNQSTILENVVNFAHIDGFLAILNTENQFLVMENDKIQFLCHEMRHMSACAESCVVWSGKSMIFVFSGHFHRLKLSGSVISAICDKERVLVKTIDGFLTLYNFSDPESVRIEKAMRPSNPAVIPSVFCIIDRFLIIGTTHGEIFNVPINSEDSEDVNSFEKRRLFEIFGGKEVSCIQTIPEALAFMTLGKTGQWTTFRIDETDGHLEILNSRSFSTASRMAWPSKFIKVDEELLIVGFYGTSLIIWNSSTNLPVFEIYCGGGHREWQLTPVTEHVWNFDFIRDGQLIRHKIDFQSKRHVAKVAHSSPIVCAAGGTDFLVTVSLDGHLCVSQEHSSSTPLLNIFVGENLLTTSILESSSQNFISTGGGKCKLSIFEFETCEDLKNHTFLLKSVSRPDEGRIVATGIAEVSADVFFIVCFSSGSIEVFSRNLETVFRHELEDSRGIGAKCHVANDLVTIGTSGGHFLQYRIAGDGKLTELRDVKLSDRSGVTAVHGSIVGCDSGHVYRIHDDCHVAPVHSHLSTVVGIAVDDDDTLIHSVSLDCVVVTSPFSNPDDVRKRRTIVDMPGGLVAIRGNLVVVGDGRCLLSSRES